MFVTLRKKVPKSFEVREMSDIAELLGPRRLSVRFAVSTGSRVSSRARCWFGDGAVSIRRRRTGGRIHCLPIEACQGVDESVRISSRQSKKPIYVDSLIKFA
jgi:hypothetical protein